MKLFEVSSSCRDLGLRAGAIRFRDVRIGPANEALRTAVASEVAGIQSRFGAPAEIRSLAEIQKLQQILRAVNVKPKSHPPSTQKLLEFAFKRGSLPAVNNLVDAYNLVSVQTRCSLGAHDLDRVDAPIQLRQFEGSESFRPLSSDSDQAIVPGEFGYVDASQRVVCRLDSLQAEFSKVTSATSDVLLIIESTTVHNRAYLEDVFERVQRLVTEHCGGTSEVCAFAE